MNCECGHTQRQHGTKLGYCAYCDCEQFRMAAQQPEPVAPLPQPVAPVPEATITEEVHGVTEALGRLDNYYRDNLLSLLLAVPEADTGDWYQEVINALETLDANPENANARPKALRASLDEEVGKLKQEIVRLSKEGSPGVMHEVDRAFYNLVVKERDAERHINDRRKLENGFLQDENETLKREIEQLKAGLPQCAVCHDPLLPGNAEITSPEHGRAHASCEEGLKDLDS